MIHFNVISIISFIISFVFLSIGLYIFLSNIKSKVHILFFCQTFACFILGFFFSFLYSLKDIDLLKNTYKIVGIGFFLCLPFAVHTYSELTGYLKKNTPFLSQRHGYNLPGLHRKQRPPLRKKRRTCLIYTTRPPRTGPQQIHFEQ